MTDALVRLNQSLERRTLSGLVKARKNGSRTSMLLIDCSFSMNSPTASGERRVDAMRLVIDALLETHSVPMAGFGMEDRSAGHANQCRMIAGKIPEPVGWTTPMAEGIRYAKAQGATHVVLISDGIPDSRDDALAAAREFGGQVDTFFIGLAAEGGATFLAELARSTGGQAGVTDLGSPLELTAGIRGLLGDGSPAGPTVFEL